MTQAERKSASAPSKGGDGSEAGGGGGRTRESLALLVALEHYTLALAAIPRHAFALLVDARSGPGRNDPAFEEALKRARGKLLFGFGRNAALASSRLQIQRYAKVDGRVVFATDDPAAAFEYLGIPTHALDF